jgi:hypothetical protein
MGFGSIIKQVVQKAKESGAIKPTDPASTPTPSGDFNFLKSIAKAAEAVPSANKPNEGLGVYRRLTAADIEEENKAKMGMKKGGKVKVSSASKRADGCAQRGKTRGKMV